MPRPRFFELIEDVNGKLSSKRVGFLLFAGVGGFVYIMMNPSDINFGVWVGAMVSGSTVMRAMEKKDVAS